MKTEFSKPENSYSIFQYDSRSLNKTLIILDRNKIVTVDLLLSLLKGIIIILGLLDNKEREKFIDLGNRKVIMKKNLISMGITAAAAITLSGCVSNPVQMGNASAKTVATGSAGGSSTNNVNSSLERCDRPVGTLGIREDTTAYWYSYMNRYGVRSVTPILRLLAQQSNCFVVVERSRRGMASLNQERGLRNSGELRSTSQMQKGQMAAADYTMTPTLTFQANDTSGISGLLGRSGKILGAALSTKEASSLLTLVDVRSGVQVAVAEGSAKANNIGGILGAIGGSGYGALAGYTKTPTGKVVVGSMTDAFNNLVRSVKNYKPQESAGSQGHGSGGTLKTY